MIFGGFQKLTLLDFPGKVACTLFTRGCNFLCPFCHNAPLVTSLEESGEYSEEEILSFLKKRVGVLEGVCITGGEPLIHAGIADFIRKLKALGYLVKLDTNGSYPERLRALIDEGLIDYVAMDIKNSKEKYPLTVGRAELELDPIEESISLLLEGKTDFEFRTTVVKELHESSDIEKIAEWISGAPRYFLQSFVDSGAVIEDGYSAHAPALMLEMAEAARKFIKNTEIRGI